MERNTFLLFACLDIANRHCDCTQCVNSRINDYLKYDYIGSPWRANRNIGLWINGGNGGFSLRSLKYCRAVSRFYDVSWPGGEDGYYAFFIEFLGGLVADLSISKTFVCNMER